MAVAEIPCEWTVVTAPTIEPITVEEAKAQARITDSASDDLIDGYIVSAREAAEQHLGRGLLTQTLKLVLDDWANVVPLPQAAPLQSITHVKYYDTDGTLQTLATSYYDTDTVSRPGRVVLKPSQSWPSLQSERRNGRVEITYVVGWTSAAAVPERIRHGIKLHVTASDLDRDGYEERAVAAMQAAQRCWSDRVFWTPPQWGA